MNSFSRSVLATLLLVVLPYFVASAVGASGPQGNLAAEFPNLSTGSGKSPLLLALKSNPALANAADATVLNGASNGAVAGALGGAAQVDEAEASLATNTEGLAKADAKPATPDQILSEFLDKTKTVVHNVAVSMDQVGQALSGQVATNPSLSTTTECTKQRAKGFAGFEKTVDGIIEAVKSGDKQKSIDAVTVAVGTEQEKLRSALVDMSSNLKDMKRLDSAGISSMFVPALSQTLVCNLQRVTLISKMKLYNLVHVKRFIDQCMFGASHGRCDAVTNEHVPKMDGISTKLPDGAAFKPAPPAPSLENLPQKDSGEAAIEMLSALRVGVDTQITQLVTLAHFSGLQYSSDEARMDDLSADCAANLKERIGKLIGAMDTLREALDQEEKLPESDKEEALREKFQRGVGRIESLKRGYQKKISETIEMLSHMTKLVESVPMDRSDKIDSFGQALMCDVHTATLAINQEITAVGQLMDALKMEVGGALNAALVNPDHPGEFLMEMNETK